MNTDYYTTLDENFAQALNMYEKDYSHQELIDFLRTGNIVQKQISALKLTEVTSKEEALVLLSNLTGCDGKIREAVSLKLNEFMSNPFMRPYFDGVNNYQIFLDAIIDINANICRNVISAIINLKSDENFCQIFLKSLVKMTKSLLDSVEKFDFQEGKYKVNKEVFKLYWCLETIYDFYDKIKFEDLKEIIKRAKSIKEYTVREKIAKILSRNFDDLELSAIREQLKNDTNYYVRRY